MTLGSETKDFISVARISTFLIHYLEPRFPEGGRGKD